MAEQQNKIIIVKQGKTLARLWWDGKKVQTDNEAFLKSLTRNKSDIPFKPSDGPDFLNYLLQHFKNGYTHAYRIGEVAKNEQ